MPFSAIGEASPRLSRQLAAFCGEAVKVASGQDINQVNLIAQVEEDGIQKAKMINLADALIEQEMIDQLFSQSDFDQIMDGALERTGDSGFSLQIRFHKRDEKAPVFEDKIDFTTAGLFPVLRTVMGEIAKQCEAEWPPKPQEATETSPEIGPDGPTFGTDNPGVFLNFLEGYDDLIYIQQAQGRVEKDYSPEPAIESLLNACKEDPDFEGPFQALVAICRMCAASQLGSFETVESALKDIQEIHPEDFLGYFALGEVYQTVGNNPRSADEFEKACQRAPQDPALWLRLGIAQLQGGMPVNAERNFRKAFELEGEDKPSADYLAMVLAQTNRGHEIPQIWKELIAKNPQNAIAHSKYAISLHQAGNEKGAIEAFEAGLETVEDKTAIKRFYAPLLVQSQEYDRAMDFYEDVLDSAPNDVQVLLEYAQTLQQADRQFEVPQVLQTVLASNPDANVRAQTQAWLIEIEQPKRVESVSSAQQKLQNQDPQGALRELRPMRNWLADYWKFWAIFAAALNAAGEHIEAEEAAKRLLDLFPANNEAYAELATSLSAQGKNEEAYQFLRFAAANMPQSLPIHINLALAAKRAGHRDEARELAKRLREAVGKNEELEPVFAEIEG